MLRRLRRFLAGLVVLIALSVLVPLAYIEGRCGPASNAPAAAAPAQALPAIDEQGYRRKLDNTFFTFPEWYIVYSFEDFGRFLDNSSESRFNYLGHITRLLAKLLHHQPRDAAGSGVPLRGQDDDLRHRHQLFRRIRHQGALREHHRPRVRMDQGRHSARRRTNMPARCCRIMPPSSTPSPGSNIRSGKSSTG